MADAPLTPRRSSQRLKKQLQDLQNPAESHDGRLELDAKPSKPTAKSSSKAGPRLNGRQKTLFVIVLALLIDLLAFTIILPLFPRLLKYYEANEAKVLYFPAPRLSVSNLVESNSNLFVRIYRRNILAFSWNKASASFVCVPPPVVRAGLLSRPMRSHLLSLSLHISHLLMNRLTVPPSPCRIAFTEL